MDQEMGIYKEDISIIHPYLRSSGIAIMYIHAYI